MNLRQRVYYSLSGSSGVIWKRLVAGASVGEAADTIARSYGIAWESAVRDVVAHATRLVDEELLVPAGVARASRWHPPASRGIEGCTSARSRSRRWPPVA
jgi:hypothetical protein